MTSREALLLKAREWQEAHGLWRDPPRNWAGVHQFMADFCLSELAAKDMEFENREAAVCPEDVGFEEFIAVLRKKVSAKEEEIEKLRKALENIRNLAQIEPPTKIQQLAVAALGDRKTSGSPAGGDGRGKVDA